MRNPTPRLALGLLLTAAGCAHHAATPPPTPTQRQNAGINAQIFQINQSPQLSPVQKQQLIAQIRASASGAPSR